ncbi:hypothetical protein [methane-oxidizing endosymbiont of Gigantopelta aegis]|uniref:hypothetical protein n=1 Tax=methane-oxidizing endosymbiont of Gigantopelta aegis TaxID=2794938 RepID=UPI0018DC9014|nr:hypothetical protein [methane-oxidizing endosymbiont of Gigantopelta aegis]
MINKFFEKGMTLLELTIVLLVLVALAGLTIPYVSGTGQMARCQATDATMRAIKEAIMGGASGPGFYGDLLGYYPKKTKGTAADYDLHYLFTRYDVGASASDWSKYNPKTAVGWRGPYLDQGRSLKADVLNKLNSTFDDTNYVHIGLKLYDGADADTTKTVQEAEKLVHIMDAWNRPIILQIPYDTYTSTYTLEYARLVSAGPGSGMKPGDAKIDTHIQYNSNQTNSCPDTNISKTFDACDRKDDRVLYLKHPDPYAAGNTPCDQL